MKIKKITPRFTGVVTTMDKYTDIKTTSGIIDPTKSISGVVNDIQTVVSFGSMVRDLKVGDKVKINPAAYAIHKYKKDSLKSEMEEYSNETISYNFNTVVLDDKEYLYLQDRDIEYVINEYEEESAVEQVDTSLIV